MLCPVTLPTGTEQELGCEPQGELGIGFLSWEPADPPPPVPWKPVGGGADDAGPHQAWLPPPASHQILTQKQVRSSFQCRHHMGARFP